MQLAARFDWLYCSRLSVTPRLFPPTHNMTAQSHDNATLKYSQEFSVFVQNSQDKENQTPLSFVQYSMCILVTFQTL